MITVKNQIITLQINSKINNSIKFVQLFFFKYIRNGEIIKTYYNKKISYWIIEKLFKSFFCSFSFFLSD